MRPSPFWGTTGIRGDEGRGMHQHDEFLWGGLRGRLERTGRLESRIEPNGPRPERRHLDFAGSAKVLYEVGQSAR